MPTIYVDADGCPVKEEVYRVARRYHLKVQVVCNRAMNVPVDELVERIVVGSRFNAADDWIAERAGEGDIAVTADIVLAARCLERGARVLGPKGHELTEDSIGTALADRELKEQLRAAGLIQGGPAPMAKEDRSRFLARLDAIVQALRGRGRAREIPP